MCKVLLWAAFWGLLFSVIVGTSPSLWAHDGKHKTLNLDEPSVPLKIEDVSTMNLDNKPVKLSDYHGKVIFLNFWATWCVPCRVEMPAMKHLEEALKGQLFAIVTVNLQESPKKIKKFFQEIKLEFDTLLDPQGEISKLYGATQLPITYIIDKEGFIVARAIGPREWESKESIGYFNYLIEKKLKKLL